MYDDDARLTVAQAAEYFELDKPVINNWFYRGHLKDVGEDESGQRTFRFGELVAAEAKTRHHPNSRRKPQLIEA